MSKAANLVNHRRIFQDAPVAQAAGGYQFGVSQSLLNLQGVLKRYFQVIAVVNQQHRYFHVRQHVGDRQRVPAQGLCVVGIHAGTRFCHGVGRNAQVAAITLVNQVQSVSELIETRRCTSSS